MTAPGKPLDLDGMEAVARAATGGPWSGDRADADYAPWEVYGHDGSDYENFIADCHVGRENALHIATFDPLTVLALIQMQRELVGALTEARRIAREMAAYLYPDTVAGMDREDLENVCVGALTKALGEQPL